MRGSIFLPMLWGSTYKVFGGRYVDRPDNMVGVKMAEEINRPCDINIPTRDFSVPKVEHMTDGLRQGVQLIAQGKPLYVGCMGGIGRTGLYLAILAKAWGINDPVAFVRSTYFSHAVETEQQRQYVEAFEVPPDVKVTIFWAKLQNFFRFNAVLTIR